MNLDELKENIKEQLQTQWAQIQESPLFIQLKEKYDDLTPGAQSAAKAMAGFFVLFLLFFPPLSWYMSSNSSLSDFEESRALLKDLIKVGAQMNQTTTTIPQLSIADVRSRIEPIITGMQLVPEQVGPDAYHENTFNPEPGSQLVPKAITQRGLDLKIRKLNLKQIVDLGYRLQTAGEGIKVMGMDIQKSPGELAYYDVTFRVVSLAIAESESTKPGPPGSKPPAPDKKS